MGNNNSNKIFDYNYIYIGASILLIFVFIFFITSLLSNNFTFKLANLILSSIFLLITIFIFILPKILEVKYYSLHNFSDTFREIKKEYGNWKSTQKEHYKLRATIEKVHKEFVKENQNLTSLHDKITGILNNSEEYEEKLSNERQKVINLKENLDEWENRAIEFLEIIERDTTNENIDDNYKRALRKVEKDYISFVEPLGIDIIKPEVGDRFDDLHHKPIDQQKNSNYNFEEIIEIKSYGYIKNEEVIKKSKVILCEGNDNSEDNNENVNIKIFYPDIKENAE